MPAAPAPSRMRREIEEIPDAVERVLAAAPDDLRALAAEVNRTRPRWVMVAARGTSDHAAVYAQYLIETHLGLPSGLVKPSVTTVYGARLAWQDGLLLAISQSGQSPDIVGVVEAARDAGALTVAITNEHPSPLAAAADWHLACHAGPELAIPATKTYVAELAVVASLVAAIRPDPALTAALAELPAVLRVTISQTDAWLGGAGNALVGALADSDRALLVSRGYNLATALELALKLKETCGLFAEAYSTADFAHGPLVLAQAAVPTIGIRPDGPMGALVDETLSGVVGRGGPATVIGGPEAASISGALSLPGVPEPLTPLQFVIPGQLLVEATAGARGISPDAPIGLGKVTRTR
ncbi:MAG TPA: SIS domain-containing protein [Candidatus Limnocylindrales bacterium]|nr:SIS domain-containing protein [Candidatus Limnocylindrales bacterium]